MLKIVQIYPKKSFRVVRKNVNFFFGNFENFGFNGLKSIFFEFFFHQKCLQMVKYILKSGLEVLKNMYNFFCNFWYFWQKSWSRGGDSGGRGGPPSTFWSSTEKLLMIIAFHSTGAAI